MKDWSLACFAIILLLLTPTCSFAEGWTLPFAMGSEVPYALSNPWPSGLILVIGFFAVALAIIRALRLRRITRTAPIVTIGIASLFVLNIILPFKVLFVIFSGDSLAGPVDLEQEGWSSFPAERRIYRDARVCRAVGGLPTAHPNGYSMKVVCHGGLWPTENA